MTPDYAAACRAALNATCTGRIVVVDEQHRAALEAIASGHVRVVPAESRWGDDHCRICWPRVDHHCESPCADPPNDTSSETQVNEAATNDFHVTCPACACSLATYPTREAVPLGSKALCDEHGEFTIYESNIWVRSEAAARVAAQAATRHAASPVAPRDADPPNDTSSEGGKLRLEDVPPEMRDLIERDQAEQHERDRAEFDRRMAERDLAHLRHANEIAEALAAHRERAASPVAPRDADHISIPRDIVPLIAAIVLCPMCGGNGGGADGEDEPGMNCDGCYPDRKVLRAALAAADHKEERCLDCRYFASGRIEACEACAALAAQDKEA